MSVDKCVTFLLQIPLIIQKTCFHLPNHYPLSPGTRECNLILHFSLYFTIQNSKLHRHRLGEAQIMRNSKSFERKISEIDTSI